MKFDSDQLRSGVEIPTLLLAVVVGVLGGLGAVGFKAAADLVQQGLVGPGNLLDAARALPWWGRLLIPTAGATLAALLLARIGRERETAGVSDLMERVSLRTGTDARVVPTVLRSLASLGVLCSGGSVGREGPILQIGAALASGTGRRFGLTGQRFGLLLGCGVAAGMAAAYNAPVAGALFALELVLSNFALDIFAPVVLASVAATTTWRTLVGPDPLYAIPAGVAPHSLPVECVAFLLLGIAAGAVASGFLRALLAGERAFGRLRVPPLLRVPLGGLAIGVMGIWLPEVWGNGFNVVDRLLHGEFAVGFVALLCVAKIVATAVSVGSGAPGGIFTPSLFVGAALGMVVGVLAQAVLPDHAGPVQAYEMVGMAGLLAGTTRAPIMAVFVLVEMTADFDMVIPLLLGAVAATAVARYLLPDSIYTGKLRRRGIHVPEGIEELALTATRVRDVMRLDAARVPPNATFDVVLAELLASRRDALYVVEEGGRLLGAIRLHEVKALLGERDLGPTLVASDLARPAAALEPDLTLAQVLETIDAPDLDEIPVVDHPTTRRLIGVVARRDVLAALAVESLRTHTLRAKFVSRATRDATYVELPAGHRLSRVPLRDGMAGRTIAELRFRATTGLSILTVIRMEASAPRRVLPEPKLRLEDGDELVVFGPEDRIDAFAAP